MSLNESIVEDVALEWFGELGYAVGQGRRRVNRWQSGKPVLARSHPAAEPGLPSEARTTIRPYRTVRIFTGMDTKL